MKIDHIHFYVEDAVRTSDWLIQKMGFQSSSQQISDHTHTEIVSSGRVSFRVSSALDRTSPVAAYLAHHPAGVADVAFVVDDLELMLDRIDRSNILVVTDSLLLPEATLRERLCSAQVACAFGDRLSHSQDAAQITIQGWGDYQHTLIANDSKKFDRAEEHQVSLVEQSGLIDIDHVVLNVAQNQLAAATQWYQELFDFRVQQSFEIQTNYSGLYSKALIDGSGQVQFNINEPSTATSQIQTFLDLHGGAGIQHVALQAQNIFQSVAQMRSQNLEFLPIPSTYYRNLRERFSCGNARRNFPLFQQEWQELEKSAVLLDWPKDAATELLLQIFTQPIFAQPTFFFEIIERRGQAQGFGEGNFLALFEAIEQEGMNLL
jgi:4-hydroxyphenylpyruvate dioxygenase